MAQQIELDKMSFKDCSVHPKLDLTDTIGWVNSVRKALAQDAQKGKKIHEPVKLFDAKRGWTEEPRPASRVKKVEIEVKPKKKGK